MPPFEISDEQRRGALLGSLLGGALTGIVGGRGIAGGLEGAARGYGGAINSIFDQQKQQLEANRMNELMQGENLKNQILGKQFQDQQEQDAAWKNMFGGPTAIAGKVGPEMSSLLSTAGPERGTQILANLLNPMNDIKNLYYLGRLKQMNNQAGRPIIGKPGEPLLDPKTLQQIGTIPGTANTPPKTREIQRGDKNVTQEWRNGEWVDVSSGPKWNPKGGMDNMGGGALNVKDFAQYPQSTQLIAQKLVRGEIPYPGGFAIRSPYWINVIQAASQLDPTFNAGEWPTRVKTRQAFTSGKYSNSINSINTLVGHLSSLKQTANSLSNSNLPAWNYLANIGETQTGDPRVTNFNTIKGAVENELATVFKGTGGSDQEIKAWSQRINSSQSPKQLSGAIDKAIELMGSRLQALKNTYKQGMGDFNHLDVLSPRSRQILQSMGYNPDTIEGRSQSQGGNSFKSGKYNVTVSY